MVIVKPGIFNVGLDHLSRSKSGEIGGAMDDQLPDADLFWLKQSQSILKTSFPSLAWGPAQKIILQLRNDTWWSEKKTTN